MLHSNEPIPQNTFYVSLVSVLEFRSKYMYLYTCVCIHHRHSLGEEQAREKERYEAKEREEIRSEERRVGKECSSGGSPYH